MINAWGISDDDFLKNVVILLQDKFESSESENESSELLWVFQYKSETLHFPFQTKISVTVHGTTRYKESVSLFHRFCIGLSYQKILDL